MLECGYFWKILPLLCKIVFYTSPTAYIMFYEEISQIPTLLWAIALSLWRVREIDEQEIRHEHTVPEEPEQAAYCCLGG